MQNVFASLAFDSRLISKIYIKLSPSPPTEHVYSYSILLQSFHTTYHLEMSTRQSFVAVAGATGNLGSLIALNLRKRNVAVKALVRPGTAASRTQTLRDAGVTIAEVEMTNVLSLTKTLEGASTVVSALQGLRDVCSVSKELFSALLSLQRCRVLSHPTFP